MELDPNLVKPLVDDLRELIAVQKQAAQAAADQSREQIERSRANDNRYRESHELQLQMQRSMLERAESTASCQPSQSKDYDNAYRAWAEANKAYSHSAKSNRFVMFLLGLAAGVTLSAAVLAMAWFVRHW